MSDTEAEIQERAARRAEARAKAEAEQRIKDLLEKEKLDEEYDGAIATITFQRYKPGLPTMAIVRVPRPEHYKRYKDQVARAAKKTDATSQVEATDLIGKASWVYPPPNDDGRMSETQIAMQEAFPGLVTSLGNTAVSLAEGKAADEGKG